MKYVKYIPTSAFVFIEDIPALFVVLMAITIGNQHLFSSLSLISVVTVLVFKRCLKQRDILGSHYKYFTFLR
jgi:hypothetical protein